MKSNRLARVNELLQRELGSICERDVVPELDALLTVTQVKASPDLRHAQVFVSVLGDSRQKEQALQVLSRQRARIQRKLGSNITLKYTPVLRFHIDERAEQADRVLAIIDQLDLPEEDTSEPPPAPDAEPSPGPGNGNG